MKKISFLFITLLLLNSCVSNKNMNNLYCYNSDRYVVILKIDSANIFESEEIITTFGIGHYHCEGKWVEISKKRLIFECDSTKNGDPYTLLPWNPYSYNQYVRIISKNKIVLHTEGFGKTILRPRWCDCVQHREISIILNDVGCDSLQERP
ncbi:hypothetical protein LJC68_10270 [Bacteroidales bacterium OttesenSCG-928-B11]|nr:hypothetical protein [Bacteroidales bacterium OttesenSCG-928-B11]